jgi:hypothetical protein
LPSSHSRSGFGSEAGFLFKISVAILILKLVKFVVD